MSFKDSFRLWRRSLKARMPYVRRREYQALERKYDSAVDSLGWTAPPAAEANLHTLKPIGQALTGEVCFFVSFASGPRLKPHVRIHIEHLLSVGVSVVLVLNTDLTPEQFALDAELSQRLSGAFLRENVGFDFAAWAHAYTLFDGVTDCTRLFLINDSIVGPLNAADFEHLIKRIRASPADVLGLTESATPLSHLQSFFLVFNAVALRNPVVHDAFRRMLSLPTKAQVIDVYETRLTQVLTRQGLHCEALFARQSDDPYTADDTIFRWEHLIRSGFPYIKTSVLARFPDSADLKALVTAKFLGSDT